MKEEVRVCLESKTHLLELYLPEIALSAPPPRKSDFLWKAVTQKQYNVAKWSPAGLRKERWIYDIPDRTLLHALSVGPGPVLCTLAKGNSVFLGLWLYSEWRAELGNWDHHLEVHEWAPSSPWTQPSAGRPSLASPAMPNLLFKSCMEQKRGTEEACHMVDVRRGCVWMASRSF